MLSDVSEQSEERVKMIMDYYMGKLSENSLPIPDKSALIQVLQYTVYVIKFLPNFDESVTNLVEVILSFFNDPFERVKLTSITSIYNIFTFLEDDCLRIFTITFKELPSVIIDPSS